MSRLFTLIVLAAVALRAPAMVFTENTEIAPGNTAYDGQDIVILDCTVTIDGQHTFSSLVLAANGVLTHSASTNGELSAALNVTNAPYVLSGTLPYLLANSNIFSPLLLTDTNGDVYTNGVDYLAVPIINNNYEISRTTNSSIPDGGTVLVSYSYYTTVPAGLDLMVTGVVWVTSGCEIDADGIGYGAGFGPGAGFSSGNMFFAGSGGGDGGGGGLSLSNAVGGVCYDSLYQPGLPGSGGGASYAGTGGNGGGLVSITSSDEMEIDGVISANGYDATNSRSGGGSGGGIFLSAPSFSGVGSLSANGGSGVPDGGGGGGGGRIAIVYGTNNFAGTMTAYGGGGANYGGAGTLFTKTTAATETPGLLVLNNNGNLGANSTVNLPVSADVTLSNGAVVAPSGTSGMFAPRNVTIGTNGVLTGQQLTRLQFSANTLTVSPGGAITVNGLGYLNGGGGGGTYVSGGVTYGGGGGHGGYGGAAAVTNATGGGVSDTQPSPTGLGGSGGGPLNGGGAGGGAIYINISGALQMNGVISANGGTGTGIANGGGAGGSIYLIAATFSGDGLVTADGGNGANSLGGGGGGGRIAISAGTNIFAGAVNCFGGGGANYGGPGTVFLSQTGPLIDSPWQNLVLDNDGNVGPSTPLQSASAAFLYVQDGAWGTLANGLTFENLLVASNSWVTLPPGTSIATVNILTNATFEAGGGLTLNSGGLNGFQQGFGQDMTFFPYAAGGGGNGGAGGAGGTNSVAGGAAGFNSILSPEYQGGNGGGYNPYSIGGIGGGAMRLTVGGTLQVDGLITANGGNGSGEGAGGGAGGVLAFTAGTVAGSGSITVNGGNGADSMGGGGGGGEIDLLFKTNLFNGTITAFGGAGANDGGAGIIFVLTNSTQFGQIIVDNGGQAGAISAISTIATYAFPRANLTVRGNSTLVFRGEQQEMGTIIVTNASLVVSNFPLYMTANNVFVQNGGRFSADAAGYAQNLGPDPGRQYAVFPYPCGGGGNGGCGGMSISNLAIGGGAPSEPYYEAAEPGSGGGGEIPYSTGGSGGGEIELNITGTLSVNGTLSANGGNGAGTGGGGGAGGSLYLVTHTLTGSGIISANGGNGANNVGGGGGGGMISIHLEQIPTNSFTGNISAYGGIGATNGGAGTVFIETNNTGLGTLIVDNGGNRGTNTPITYSSSTYAIVIRNGAVVTLSASSSEAFSSLLIASNGWLIPNVAQPGAIGSVSLSLTLGGTIQAGGGIIADSDGYSQNSGIGYGSTLATSPTYPCSGAGHGGYGAFASSNLVPGGVTYDSISSPQFAGSGGGGLLPYSTGGTGGGIINLSAKGGVLQINGAISANGGNGSGIGGGGGSGGAIYLTANSIIGTGSITANGGNGAAYGGGGGGGCIALASTAELRTNLFLGAISAYGGGGANYGGAGTLFYSTNSFAGNQPSELYLDNDGNVGTDTTLNVNGPVVVIQNGAIGAISTGTWLPNSVLVLSNSELTALTGQAIVQAASIAIATGGVFSVDGGGYPAQTGPGAGSVIGGISGGGGHGGYGGGNMSPTSASGTAYDSIQAPKAEGSGGASSSSRFGGAGGGVLTLNLSNLVVNGRISANGRAGGIDAGGGSGGSINITGMPSAPGTLSVSGTGIISANGGAGSGLGGGGAGGRISITSSLNTYTGQFSASGGAGSSPGGAGTVFTSVTGSQTLLINNGGLAGANTPLSSAFTLPSTPFELDISGGASVVPLTPLPLLSNLNVSAASTLTMPVAQSAMFIGVTSNATIAGDLDVDYLGYSQTNGPGAGVAVDNEGSGGGYGGKGGASDSGAPGGKTYGSAAGPTDFGSGGGNGADTTTGGSAGGGALRLSVSGTLAVNGNISANGDSGLQDDSGGGSGGSVWISAGTLSGAGTISAYGGDGVLYGGGGGGGGRIAIYAQTNQFTGTTNVSGGLGIVSGQPGTVSMFAGFNGLQILSQSPTGTVMGAVSSVNLTFSDMLNASSLYASEFTLVTPTGPVSASNLYLALEGPNSVQLTFPTQGAGGTYTVQVATNVYDMFGQSLAQPYTGTFTISAPTISGTVTGTNGAGVAGVSLQATGLAAVITDTNGNYSLGVPYGWTGTVTPSFGSYVFSPPSTSYVNIAASAANQNYSAFQAVSPALSASQNAGRWTLNWNGLSGVSYQVLWSTNLVTWQPLGSPVPGSSGPMEYSMPAGSNAQEYFQIQAVY